MRGGRPLWSVALEAQEEEREERGAGTNDGVEFDFTITLAGASHRGVERVFVGDNGRITRVEVER